jgi:hypothetical protein
MPRRSKETYQGENAMTHINGDTPATLTPEQVAEGHTTVPMEFTQPVRFTLSDGAFWQTVEFPIGTHQVRSEWADHWFLLAQGARVL